MERTCKTCIHYNVNEEKCYMCHATHQEQECEDYYKVIDIDLIKAFSAALSIVSVVSALLFLLYLALGA